MMIKGSKAALLNTLYDEYRREFEGNEIVTGDGNTDSGILIIGEAPGSSEVREGKPFVGAAGKNFAEMLKILEMDRESVYITNAIKYRLSRVNERTGRISNRPATDEEIKRNRHYLMREIEVLKPSYIITLGNVPLRAITDDLSISIGKVHGELEKVKISGADYFFYPLYHPASIIYNQEMKKIYINDILKLKHVLKGFFKS